MAGISAAHSMSRKKRKVRADFRKNREVRARDRQSVHRLTDEESALADAPQGERLSGKGDISRKRTLAGGEIIEDDAGTLVLPEVDRDVCRLGRVLRVQGLVNIVREEAPRHPHPARFASSPLPEGEGERVFKCA